MISKVKCIKMNKLILPALLCGLSPAFGGVVINEFMAKNDSGITNQAGIFSDWIEIHNNSGSAVDLAGWYLTDDITDLRKWQFPSTGNTSPLRDDGYLLVYADDSPDAVVGDEIHASFKLGSGGEFLALIEPDGETISYQYNPEYPSQSADVSYGIDPGSGEHAYFSNPTPGAANAAAIAETVRYSVGSRAFAKPFSLELWADSPLAEIRYTTNGAMPDASSLLYVAPLTISSTTRVRARVIEAGLVDGAVVSENFYHLDPSVADFSSDLPLVVIDNFGAGEIPHGDDGPARQPCGVMFFESDSGIVSLTNSPVIASRAGLRRRGETSKRPSESKPNLSLETWGEVDEDSRSIKPLGMPAESDWILHAPWTIDTAMMRNSFIYEVSNEIGRYAVRTRFVEVFLNYDGGSLTASDYYGVHEFMEKIKQDPSRVDIQELAPGVTDEPEITGGYIFKKDKDDPDDQNFVAAGATLTAVDPSFLPSAQLAWLTSYINQVDVAIPNGNYGALIDVDSFVDHHILNVFAQNADGLRVSTFYHKDREGLLNMGPIWDFDRSMGCDVDLRPSDPEVWSLSDGAGGGDTQYFFHNGGPLWFRELALNDPEFWITWVDRWQAMREGPLREAALIERIERYRSEIANAANRNYERWPGLIEGTNWAGKVDGFLNHVVTRGQWIDEQLVDPPVFGNAGGLVHAGYELSLTGQEAVYITIDGSDPRNVGGSPVGAQYSTPIQITENTLVKARAWNGQNFVNAPNTWPWSALKEVMLVVEPAPLAVTEIMYHPRPAQDEIEMEYSTSDFEFIEIRNTGASPCSLVGVQFLDGVSFDFTYGSRSTLGAGEYGVVVRNLEAFKVRYPNWQTMTILGEFEGRLSDGSEEIELGYDPATQIMLADFDYEDDWYPATDGEGFSLVLNDDSSNPATWDSKTAWTHSSNIDGSPGEADPVPTFENGSVVINEVLTHQDTDNPGDWIELHNTTGSPIDIGGWFLSDSRGELTKYAIPTSTTIPANGYLVFTEYDDFGHAFALSEHGDSVFLSSGDGSVLTEPAYRESVSFGPQERDVTFGRHVRSDGSPVFVSQESVTIGGTNSLPYVGSVVIEEVMYHPPLGGHEYIRLKNTSGSIMQFYDETYPSNVWKISGIDFEFPLGTELGAGESLLLVRDTITPENFRQTFQVSPSIGILNYPGRLENDSDTLKLKKPGTPESGTGYVPYIIVEEFKYNDSLPWPVEADGLGKALGRIDSAALANDVGNWMAINAAYVPALYSLNVFSGIGDGVYSEGTEVAIEATITNQSFVRWIGNVNSVADRESPSTTLVMPAQDITLSALHSGSMTFVEAGANWKYHDQGQDLGASWRAMGFDDSGWASGNAQLGYNDAGTVTTVGYGGDSGNKYPTTYFRNSFTVDNASDVADLVLRLQRDDGAVVYLNGVEVVRDNMPDGSINYLTYASATVGGASEDTFYPFNVSSSALVDGVNTLAVEIHQRSPTSSDLSFALSLEGTVLVDGARLDGDADGMYDAWETNHFDSTETAWPDDDPDQDGSVNSNEFIAGTLPFDPSSYFRIDGFNDGELSWSAVSGRTYSVYWTEQLNEPYVQVSSGLTSSEFPVNTAPTSGYYKITVEME